MLVETYYQPKDLPKFGEIGKNAPELAKKFFAYYDEVFTESELTECEKALIALAVAHTIQCPYCIDAFTRDCLSKGSNLDEMTEAVHVAVGDPWRSLARSWHPNAKHCRKDLHVREESSI